MSTMNAQRTKKHASNHSWFEHLDFPWIFCCPCWPGQPGLETRTASKLIVYLRNALSSMDCNPTPLVMPGGLGYTVLIGCIPYWYMEFDLVDPSRGWYQFLTMHLVDSTVNHPSCQRIECLCQDLSRCLL